MADSVYEVSRCIYILQLVDSYFLMKPIVAEFSLLKTYRIFFNLMNFVRCIKETYGKSSNFLK